MKSPLPLLALLASSTLVTLADPPTVATGLKSFEGIEEPKVKYNPARDRFEPDDFVNITDVGNGAVRMALRYVPGKWWDGDRTTQSKDRQRAEVKGLGPHQKDGDIFEYATTWRTNDSFKGANRFCHVFQLKATDGDNGAPLIVLSVMPGTNRAAVRYCSGDTSGFKIAREFAWKPGALQTVKIRVRTTTKNDGEVMVSVDGDPYQGVEKVAVFRPGSTTYRPKWGLYRGVDKNTVVGDDYVEHKDASAQKL
jgi:hypothetical protein